jgi:hypothetical protein
MAATEAWLDCIASALGQTQLGASPSATQAREWNALRERAARHVLGVVVRDREIFYLTTPSRNWGVPLVRLLEEMGFGLEILVGVSDRATANKAARDIRDMFAHPTRHAVLAFDGLRLLQHRLSESRSSAIFSYHFFDWRITSAGKAIFSLQQFEVGRSGAIRSLKRLLRVCETSFYRRYSRFLQRSPSGLRIEEYKS